MNLSLVDPELAVALAQFAQMDIWSDLPLSRKLIAQARLGLMAAPPAIENVTITDYSVPSTAVLGASAAPEVSVRVYRPEDQTQHLPALLWIHGGGYCLGRNFGRQRIDNSIKRYFRLCKQLPSCKSSCE